MKNNFTFLSVLASLLIFNQVKATPLSASISNISNVACNGGYTGSATVNASGGTSPYTYSWTPGGGSSAMASNLSAGTYTVVVADAALNFTTASVTITQPTILLASITAVKDTICKGNSSVMTANTTGGTTPYNYSWTPAGALASTATVTPLASTCYTVTVTDKNGCNTNTIKCIIVETCTGINGMTTDEPVWKVYPNPSNGKFTIQSAMLSGTETSINIYNVLGEKVYSKFSIFNPPFSIDLSSQPNGVYFYRLISTDGEAIGSGKIMIDR